MPITNSKTKALLLVLDQVLKIVMDLMVIA